MTSGHAQIRQSSLGPGGHNLVDIPAHPVPDHQPGIGQDMPGTAAEGSADEHLRTAGQHGRDPGGSSVSRRMNLSSRGEVASLPLEQEEPGGIVKQGRQSVIICSKADTHTGHTLNSVTVWVQKADTHTAPGAMGLNPRSTPRDGPKFLLWARCRQQGVK